MVNFKLNPQQVNKTPVFAPRGEGDISRKAATRADRRTSGFSAGLRDTHVLFEVFVCVFTQLYSYV